MNTTPLDLTPALAVALDGERIEVGDDTVTIAVVVENHAVTVVLRALAEPDVAVRIPVSDHDAEHLTRALAGSLRYLHHARGCPACDPHWDQP